MEKQIELNKNLKFILFSKELNEYEKLILCSFASIENELNVYGKYFQVYQDWLGTQLNISLRETKKVISSLSDKGILSVLKCRKNGHLTNAYKIIWDKISKDIPIDYKKNISTNDIEKDIEAEKVKKDKEARELFISKDNVIDFKIINTSKCLKYPEKGVLGCLLMTAAYSKTKGYLAIPYDYIKKRQMYDKTITNEILDKLSNDKIVSVIGNEFKINYFNLAVKINAINESDILDSMFL